MRDVDDAPKAAPGDALLRGATSAHAATSGPGVMRAAAVANAGELTQYLTSGGQLTAGTFDAVAAANREITSLIAGKSSLREVDPDDRKTLRTDLFLVDQTLAKLNGTGEITEPRERKAFADYRRHLDTTTKYIPLWVKVAVAIALGGGTMVGWKRIVTTVGERIGRQPLTYAQGASAELVAMTTIGLADHFGMPVSTTHVLSSGIAGTMAANRSGLQGATVRNILLAWLLTLPVCILLGAATFAAGLYVVLKDIVAETTGVLLIGIAALIARRVIARHRRLAAI
jgi:PiT family inorganic phosphate transporter